MFSLEVERTIRTQNKTEKEINKKKTQKQKGHDSKIQKENNKKNKTKQQIYTKENTN